jgi:hypothetical protein
MALLCMVLSGFLAAALLMLVQCLFDLSAAFMF